MSATCAPNCGACCEVIGLVEHPRNFQHTLNGAWYPQGWWKLKAYEMTSPEYLRKWHEQIFIAQHWHAVTPEEANAIHPHFTEQMPNRWYYTCDQYDAETKRCLAHETRPAICRNFPWYGGEPRLGVITPWPKCSYWSDVPYELWPKNVDPLPYPVNAC